ncbi:hypothetical protein ARMGADRAFT_875213, partial [Armillaria gallica]
SDLKFRPHEDDIWIGEHQVMNIEHADDGALFSSAKGLQSHLDEYSCWTNQKGLRVYIAKTKAMVFGRVPETLPTFRINGDPVEWVNEHRYIGVNFTSSHANIFKIHYGIKSKVAKKMASATFTLDKFLGDLPPREGLILYNSQADPHLTYGAEVAIDVSLNDVALLEYVQHLYMRRLLHLYRRSMIDVLWSETGMWPLAYRRICFALRYLAKVLLLPEHRIPVWCVEANVTLWTRQKSCWLGDIAVVLRRLGLPESQTSLEALTDAGQVVELINALPVLIREKVRDVIEGSTKLPLMQGRIERLPRNGSSKSQWLFRAYHLIRIPAHRIAVTRLITSCHGLAVERGRWLKVVGTRESVPFQFRICRLCKDSVEDELHVLFMC